jgi:8-oxo-dGTP pyrophosphatase MutT (NUDIX family)
VSAPDGDARAHAEGGGPGRSFTPLGGETVYDGRLVDVRIERFRHSDGEEVSREIVRHRGAVAVVAHDHARVWLVRQPREAVNEPALLEIPAGRLDVEGEEPLQAARRELAEEIGFGARSWEAILTYYSSAGFTDERVHLFAATDLYESKAHSEENERIEIVQWPLEQLELAIEDCLDAKTLIGLLWLARRLNDGLQRQGATAAEAKPGG